MAHVEITGLRKAYGRVRALDGVDLTVAAGELTAVLGPSGCGKTTMLRCLAGFERPDAGTIRVAGRVVAGPAGHVPPHRRRIAVVPQEGALFPHLSVAGNVGYGLDRAARRAGRVEEALALVGLSGYGDRMPHQLSGGQQQRVAVARALAPRPSLVLLDEPFSALDAALRGELRRDVRAALRADGATAVLVTHDRGEALSMADAVAVLRAGRIVQAGPPVDVYREPVDAWVAGFLGDAVVLPAVVRDGWADTALGRLPLTGPGGAGRGASGPGGGAGPGAAAVLIRPEQVDLVPAAEAATHGGVSATVLRYDFHGHDALVSLRLADGTAVAVRLLDPTGPLAAGEPARLRVRGPVRAVAAPAAP